MSNAERRVRRLAIAVADRGYGRRVAVGVIRWAKANPGWVAADFGELGARPGSVGELLGKAKPDAIVAQVAGDRALSELRSLQAPVVNVSNVCQTPFACVGIDDVAVGRAAGRHLSAQRHVHFACLLNGWVNYSHDRLRGFLEVVGGDVSCLDTRQSDVGLDRVQRWDALVGWLRRLPKPCGLFLAASRTGQWPAMAARQADLRIPEDLAVVTVGDDPVANELQEPPLTTVDYPAEHIGRVAAELAASLADGGEPPSAPLRFGPTDLTVRASSDRTVVHDELVEAAMRRLRADLPNVEPNALADELAVSRRTLERRFIAALGRSVHAEVERLRVERAKALLSGTDLPLKAIAVQVGLCRRQGLYEAFGRCVGITPVVYRRRTRLGK